MISKNLVFIAIYFVVTLLSTQNLSAQKEFSTEHEVFLRQFSRSFRDVKLIDRDGKALSDAFEMFWLSDTLSVETKDAFIDNANLLASKGGVSYPHFYLMAENIIWFHRREMKIERYENWQQGLIDLLTDRRRPNKNIITAYQMIANQVFKDSVVMSSPRVEWKVSQLPSDIGYANGKPYIKFSNTDLIASHADDEMRIFGTSGTVHPIEKTWKGQFGKVTWGRVALSPDSVYAELNKYNIDLSKAELDADSARFINLNYFDTPLLGKLEDKVSNLDNPVKSSYPRFTTYTKKFELSGVLEGIDYEGGFSMRGQRFIGAGQRNEKAKITIVKNDTVKLVALSEAFTIDSKQIFSSNTEITIHLSKDSIYHPNLILRYTFVDKMLDLQRTGEGMSKVYFTNSYHAMHMDFTWLQWDIEKYKIHFGMLKSMSGVNEAFFESADYFSENRYRQIQVQDEIHPFRRLEEFVGWYGSPEFTVMDFAQYIGYSPFQVKKFLLRLAYLGFLQYDTATEVVSIKPETYKYLDAMRRVVDYDVIQFNSTTKGTTPNASLSLLNYDLEILGVPTVHLSDSQNVEIYPIDRKLIMKKNRDFVFTGTMKASQFFFYGHDFRFKYNDFMVEMEQCDSMKMIVETGKLMPDGGKILKIVQATIEDVKGDYYIDEPSNKSGRHDMPQYPRFVSKKESYVYYDAPEIFNGVYNRHRFFFKIAPYEIDSLQGYARKNLEFEGTFYSADIFPDMQEVLGVRPDYSLGFHRVTDDDGFPAYQGKGQYTRHIDLSNEGLRGAGRIEYLNATAFTDSVLFFPDSCFAHANTLDMLAQTSPIEYPSVKGVDNDVVWYPYRDQFQAKTVSTKFEMFEKQSKMSGMLTLTPTRLEGEGVMDIERSKLYSNKFTYKRQYVDADTASFKLLTENQLDIDFSTVNVNAHIDFPERKGHFRSNGEGTYVTFPKNQYIGFMKELVWHMDEEVVDIKSDAETAEKLKNDPDMSDEEWEDLFLEGPKFISVHPDQDSLNFVAPSAKYDLKNYVITAEGVNFIRVADATIYTGDGEVVVEKKAVMRPLQDAEIIANTTSRYHKIKESTVSVYGRKSYTAYGDYDYKDKAGRIQTIHFNRVGVDDIGQTFAEGAISEADKFSLSPNFSFQGDVELFASQKNLTFDGGAAMKHDCSQLDIRWLKFRAMIDPEEIEIPVDSTPMGINGGELAAGLMIYRDSAYAAMYSPKERRTDKTLFTADGFLIFDEDDMSYKVSNRDKLQESSLPGNLLRLGRVDCIMNGQGRLNFSEEFGRFKPNPIGDFRHNLADDTTRMDLVMLMDFHFNNKALKIFAEDINKAPGLTGTDLGSDVYEYAILEYLGQEDAEEWFTEMSMGNMDKVPKKMEDLFILTDVNMTFYKENSSYIHEGPVGVSQMGGVPVNRNVFSFISVEKNRRGDNFNMYFELDSETWYYFRFTAGNMAAISSNKTFNEEVYESKPRDRLIDAEGKIPSYRYSLGSKTYLRRFLKEMNEMFGYDEED
ncbi:MAG: hypothetical protein U9N51_03005 [Bacteroidota bacterium]|nr:hypothetical protein [Bacteroidota bacterium]